MSTLRQPSLQTRTPITRCRLLAQSRHAQSADECPLSGV